MYTTLTALLHHRPPWAPSTAPTTVVRLRDEQCPVQAQGEDLSDGARHPPEPSGAGPVVPAMNSMSAEERPAPPSHASTGSPASGTGATGRPPHHEIEPVAAVSRRGERTAGAASFDGLEDTTTGAVSQWSASPAGGRWVTTDPERHRSVEGTCRRSSPVATVQKPLTPRGSDRRGVGHHLIAPGRPRSH